MSYLFKSGKLDRIALSDDELVKKWSDIGFLEDLDREMRSKVALCFEITVLMIKIREIHWDIEYKITGEEFFYKNDNFKMVSLPIMRRVASKIERPEHNVLEIFSIAEKKMNNFLAVGILSQDESCLKYFYDSILLGGHYEKQGWNPKYLSYSELENAALLRGMSINKFIDWEAEYTAYVADIIVDYFNEKNGETGI